MAILHIMVGLPCSGKTTYARQLAKAQNALLLTPDVWHIMLFGNDTLEASHDQRHTLVEKLMWSVAEDALKLGLSVILDFGFWSRAEREDLRTRAKALGVGFQMHFLDVSKEELFARLDKRNKHLGEDVFIIPPSLMESFIGMFEAPSGDELEP